MNSLNPPTYTPYCPHLDAVFSLSIINSTQLNSTQLQPNTNQKSTILHYINSTIYDMSISPFAIYIQSPNLAIQLFLQTHMKKKKKKKKKKATEILLERKKNM
ncbi:hypothetical protein ACJQWK_00233 [Exserohilum turcicum]